MDKEQVYRILNQAYFSEDCDEKEVLERLAPVVENTKCFIDIGASLGQYTRFANQHMTDGEIYAIEADPIRFEELERNCRKWVKESTNALYPIHAAVSDKEGTITFFTTNSNTSGGLFVHPVKNTDVQWEKIVVKTIRLDEYFADMEPDFVKMDIEGSELRALAGARNILARGKALFFVEVHSWADPEGQKNQYEVYDFMKDAGYEITRIKGRILFKPDPEARRGSTTAPSQASSASEHRSAPVDGRATPVPKVSAAAALRERRFLGWLRKIFS